MQCVISLWVISEEEQNLLRVKEKCLLKDKYFLDFGRFMYFKIVNMKDWVFGGLLDY